MSDLIITEGLPVKKPEIFLAFQLHFSKKWNIFHSTDNHWTSPKQEAYPWQPVLPIKISYENESSNLSLSEWNWAIETRYLWRRQPVHSAAGIVLDYWRKWLRCQVNVRFVWTVKLSHLSALVHHFWNSLPCTVCLLDCRRFLIASIRWVPMRYTRAFHYHFFERWLPSAPYGPHEWWSFDSGAGGKWPKNLWFVRANKIVWK